MSPSYVAKYFISFIVGALYGFMVTLTWHEFRHGSWNRPSSHNSRRDAAGIHQSIVFENLDTTTYHKKEDAVVKEHSKSVRVLCWVMTQPTNIKTNAQAVKATWGKRCHLTLFMSSKEDKEIPVVRLNVLEGRENLWLKTRAAWKYVFEHHIDDADWFLKADDDTYVVVENLHSFLSKHNTREPHYFGRHFVPYGGFNSGGAGYVFSKETLIRFYKVMNDSSQCPLQSPAEDIEVGRCLSKTGVTPGDTRDEYGLETFNPFSPTIQFDPETANKTDWMFTYNKYRPVFGPNSCSNRSITFHYISMQMMYVLDYLIYYLHPYEINPNSH